MDRQKNNTSIKTLLARFFKENTSLFIFLLYALVTAVIYGHSIEYPFIGDDHPQILNNKVIQNFNLNGIWTASTIADQTADRNVGMYYKPFMGTVYATIWYFFKTQVQPWRLFQFFIFTLNAFFVYLLLRSSVKQTLLPFLAGLLFLVHPINTENAVYIANYQDVLYFFFGSLALIAATFDKKNSFTTYILPFVFLMLSLFSKETGGIFLIAYFLQSILSDSKKWKASLLVVSGSLLVYLTARLGFAFLDPHSGYNPIMSASFLERALTFPKIVELSVYSLLLYDKIALTVDFVVQSFLSFDQFIRPFIILITSSCFLYFCFRYSQKKRDTLLFLAILLANTGLHSHLILPLDGTLAYRWLYLSLFSILALMVLILSRLQETWQKATVFVVGILFAIYSGFASFQYSKEWANPLLFYQSQLLRKSNNAVIVNNLGLIHYQEKKYDLARNYFKEAIAMRPRWPVPYTNLGILEDETRNLLDAEKYFIQSIRLERKSKYFSNLLYFYKKNNMAEKMKQFLDRDPEFMKVLNSPAN